MNLPLLLVALLAQLGQIQVPKPVGYVNDFAHVVNADMSARLERIIGDVKTKSGGEIVVVTLPADVARDVRWITPLQGFSRQRSIVLDVSSSLVGIICNETVTLIKMHSDKRVTVRSIILMNRQRQRIRTAA